MNLFVDDDGGGRKVGNIELGGENYSELPKSNRTYSAQLGLGPFTNKNRAQMKKSLSNTKEYEEFNYSLIEPILEELKKIDDHDIESFEIKLPESQFKYIRNGEKIDLSLLSKYCNSLPLNQNLID
jgi:hypothetical protein